MAPFFLESPRSGYNSIQGNYLSPHKSKLAINWELFSDFKKVALGWIWSESPSGENEIFLSPEICALDHPRIVTSFFSTSLLDPLQETVLPFLDDQLLYSMINMYTAGTASVTTTLLWCFLYMLENPEEQKMVQAELDNIATPDKFIRWEDRRKNWSKLFRAVQKFARF